MNRATIWGVLLTLCLLSCGRGALYHSYRPTGSEGWFRDDTLTFRPDSPLAAGEARRLLVGIRHSDSYAYRDLWLVVNNDTLHVHLADSSHRWYGKGFGELRQLTVPMNLDRPEGDSIREVRIVHIMQDNPLTGIHDVGIQIGGDY